MVGELVSDVIDRLDDIAADGEERLVDALDDIGAGFQATRRVTGRSLADSNISCDGLLHRYRIVRSFPSLLLWPEDGEQNLAPCGQLVTWQVCDVDT